MIRRTLVSVALFGATVAASQAAITFSNFSYDPTYFTADPTVLGNALTWFPTNTTVGDLSSLRNLNLTFSFDAVSTDQIVTANTSGQTFTVGSGTVTFTQTVYALDASGNQTGTLATLTTGSTSNALNFAPSTRIRVVSSFNLSAVDTADFDYADISSINQNLTTQSTPSVPGPGALASFAVGGVGMLRRRARRSARNAR